MAAVDSLRFYRVGDVYGEFSNFAAYPIVLDGVVWPTSEHYFQAQKFADPQIAEQIRRSPSAGDAAGIGRRRDLPLRPGWSAARVSVMRRAVDAKFSQNRQLADLLLGTGTARLVEHTANDRFWADAGDGTGTNMLGRILADQRSALRARHDQVDRARARYGKAAGWLLFAPDQVVVVEPWQDPPEILLAVTGGVGRVLWVEPPGPSGHLVGGGP